MERDTEIAQIEHDLEILRARYALYDRTGRILKGLAPLCGALITIGAVVALIKIFERDFLFGAIFIVVVLICVWIFWPTFSYDKSIRWIDIVSIPMVIYSNPWRYDPRSGPRNFCSDAMIIERQIAQLEQRLAELAVSDRQL